MAPVGYRGPSRSPSTHGPSPYSFPYLCNPLLLHVSIFSYSLSSFCPSSGERCGRDFLHVRTDLVRGRVRDRLDVIIVVIFVPFGAGPTPPFPGPTSVFESGEGNERNDDEDNDDDDDDELG